MKLVNGFELVILGINYINNQTKEDFVVIPQFYRHTVEIGYRCFFLREDQTPPTYPFHYYKYELIVDPLVWI